MTTSPTLSLVVTSEEKAETDAAMDVAAVGIRARTTTTLSASHPADTAASKAAPASHVQEIGHISPCTREEQKRSAGRSLLPIALRSQRRRDRRHDATSDVWRRGEGERRQRRAVAETL